MFGLLKDITKTVVSVAATPVALASDIVKLPVTSYEDKSPFGETEKMIGNVKKNFNNVVDPNRD
ncbi:MAG TPA: hypothetical protein VFM18_10540 [Methanosarcina sp.]|nr:hypothetical protein [Methanosarcina sp.]